MLELSRLRPARAAKAAQSGEPPTYLPSRPAAAPLCCEMHQQPTPPCQLIRAAAPSSQPTNTSPTPATAGTPHCRCAAPQKPMLPTVGLTMGIKLRGRGFHKAPAGKHCTMAGQGVPVKNSDIHNGVLGIKNANGTPLLFEGLYNRGPSGELILKQAANTQVTGSGAAHSPAHHLCPCSMSGACHVCPSRPARQPPCPRQETLPAAPAADQHPDSHHMQTLTQPHVTHHTLPPPLPAHSPPASLQFLGRLANKLGTAPEALAEQLSVEVHGIAGNPSMAGTRAVVYIKDPALLSTVPFVKVECLPSPQAGVAARTPSCRCPMRRHHARRQATPIAGASTLRLPCSCSTTALVKRMKLLLSGDVEENPGPPPRQQQRVESWLGVSDAAATAIMGRIRYAAAQLERMPCDPELPQERPGHKWNHLAMRILASCVERILPPVDGIQGLLAGDVAGLPNSAGFDAYGSTYLSWLHPIPSLELKHTEGDGNCHLRSLLISVLGSEESGWVALRLRCLLHFLVNSARYHQAESGPGVASTDYGASVFTPLTKPASSLSGLASAIAASVLQCPILLFNPGHKMIPHRELESGYIPPLFVREGGYASKLPIIQMWAYCGGGAPVETTPWRPNHFEAGFLPTAAHYSALLSVTEQHDLHLQGYYEQGAGRDPGWAWDTQTRYELHQLPNESPERHLIEEVLTSVQNILAPRPAMARRGRQGASGGPGPKPSPTPFPPPPGKAAQPIGTMGDGPPPRLAQRHQTRLSVAAAQAIDIDRGTGSQQSPAPPTGKSLKRKCSRYLQAAAKKGLL